MTLTEQMRQQNDVIFQNMLLRARKGELNMGDVHTLNERIARQLPAAGSLDTLIIVQSNTKRHLIDRQQTERFAHSKKQMIFIFPAKHSRTKKKRHAYDPVGKTF